MRRLKTSARFAAFLALALGVSARASFTLHWIDNDTPSDETGFVIQRADDGGDFVQIAIVPRTVTTYQDTTVDSSIIHAYQVCAYNATGYSLFSNLVITAAVTWPAPPAIGFGTALSATQLDATASVIGTFLYTPAAGTVLAIGANQPLSAYFTPADPVDFAPIAISNSITVTSLSPIFLTQPASQTVATGSTVVFTVALAPDGPAASYQWQLNGANIAGATQSQLIVPDATAANSGSYTCLATGGGISSTSAPARLTLSNTTDPGRLVNCSVNTLAGKSQILTVGFATGGTGTNGSQALLIRADGPALSAFGLANVLADPALAVFSGQSEVAANDNWGAPASNAAAVAAADTATSAFPLTNIAGLDAALVASLSGGAYTVQVSGNGPGSGTVLAELYDDTPAGTYTPATPRLVNISCNDQVAAKGSLTAGFVVGGTTSKTVLIRADGPALAAAPFNLSGAMPDPQLALHTTVDGQDTVLVTNGGWGGNPQIAAVDSAVFAFALNPLSADSALLVTLPPGAYTAVASSVSGTAGIVLVEVYDVP